MKVLHLVDKKVHDTKMSRVRFDQVEAIGRQVPTWISGPGWPDWDEMKSAAANVVGIRIAGDLADVVHVYGVEGLEACQIPTITAFNEAFDVPKVLGYVQRNKIAGVVFHHENDLRRYLGWNNDVPMTHIHHCASEKVFADYGHAGSKDIDVLVAGNQNQSYYPLRYRLGQLALKVLRKRGYKVVHLQHPGYMLPPREGTLVGRDFAETINRSKVVVTCSMRFKYALAKYSEIALSRSLAVADIPDERREFFEDTVLAVHPHELDSVILDRIEDVLDDASKLKKLTDRAWSETQKTSTMAHYAERFLRFARIVANKGPR